MKIRINDKSSNNIAECDLIHYDTGVWHVQEKVNIAKVFGDLKQSDKVLVLYSSYCGRHAA